MKATPKTYRLDPGTLAKLAYLQEKLGGVLPLNATDVIKVAIDKLYKENKTMTIKTYAELTTAYETNAYGSEMYYDNSTGNYTPANPNAVDSDFLNEAGQVDGDEYQEGLQEYAKSHGVNMDNL